METDKILYAEFERVDPERSLGNSFDNGEISYKKFMSTASKINLAKSYMKLTLSLTNSTGGDLTLKDNIAPAYLACEALFKQIYYKINNVIVSEVSDYTGPICALRNRLQYTQSYRDTLLKDLNYGKVDFSERQKSFLNISNNTGDQTEIKTKPSDGTVTFPVGNQIQFTTDPGNAVVVGDIIEIYDNANASSLQYRGVIRTRVGVNSNVTPALNIDAIPATANWCIVKKVNNQRGTRKLELIFKPSLGIFSNNDWIMGHDLELCFFPHSSSLFKKYFVESVVSDKVPLTDYDVVIDDMVFYPYIGYVEKSIEQGEQSVEFLETRCQLQDITSQTNISRTFVIDAQTKFITMALRDARASGGNTLFPVTKFKVGKNSAGVDTDLDLVSWSILYDIFQFPRPQHNQEKSATVDRLAQAYYENLVYSDQIMLQKDIESLTDFQKLGPYYHYRIPIRPGQSNPKLSINTSFRSAFSNEARPVIMLFDHFHRSFKLVARNGRVIQVESQYFAE